MADKTEIEWTDATWNLITGCSIVSPGCTNCYAMRLAGTRLAHTPSRAGLTTPSKAGPVWNGEVRFNEGMLLDPLKWRKPRMIFVCAHGDLFHESVPDAWIDRVFAVMALAPQHTFQVLTKRADRMRKYFANPDLRSKRVAQAFLDLMISLKIVKYLDDENYPLKDGQPDDEPRLANMPLPNVWLGVSVEDQRRADERIPHLLETPAAVRWISAEPLLGPLDIGVGLPGEFDDDLTPGIDWVVAGGESGPGARPIHPDWARSLRDQCAAAGVPFHFKQWGDWVSFFDMEKDEKNCIHLPTTDGQTKRGATRWHNLAGGCGFHGERVVAMRNVGKKRAGRVLDGRTHDEFPNIGDA